MAVLIPSEIQNFGTFAISANKANRARVDTANALARQALDGNGAKYRQLRCLGGDQAPELLKEFSAGASGCGFADKHARDYARVLGDWVGIQLAVPSYAPSVPDIVPPAVGATPPVPPAVTQPAAPSPVDDPGFGLPSTYDGSYVPTPATAATAAAAAGTGGAIRFEYLALGALAFYLLAVKR